MEIQQLELELWQSLAAASQFPETADLRSLCDALEQLLLQQPLSAQLRVAAEVLVQLSDVCVARSQLMIAAWEHRHTPTEPVVDLQECVELFVQSLSLDVAELFEAPEAVQYPANRKQQLLLNPEDSVVGEVDQATLLGLVDELSQAQPLGEVEVVQQIRRLAHGENVEEWSRAIDQALQSFNSAARLVELQRTLKMPMVEVWLALLLGGYELEQKGEFYDTRSIWVVKGVLSAELMS